MRRTAGSWLLLGLAIGVCACGRSADRAVFAASQQPQAPASKPAPPPQQKSAPELESEELLGLVSKVMQQERAQAATDKAGLLAAWKNAAPKPKVLFEVPALRCGYADANQKKQRSRSASLCYSDPKLELWGLGPFAVADDGALWIDDAVTGRAVGFDRRGKLVDSVAYGSEPENPNSLVVTSTDIWIDSLSPGDHESTGWLHRTSRDGRTSRSYRSETLVGAEYQDRGWVIPSNPSRIMRWYADGPTDVVDVSFLDDTRMQISAPHPLRARGHRYWVDCEPDLDAKNARPATLVIDDHAVPAPGCLQIQYVGPEGDIVAGADGPYYHFDVHGKLLDIAVRGSSDFQLLTSGFDTAVGPDGKVYQYLPQKRSVQFVELPRFAARP